MVSRFGKAVEIEARRQTSIRRVHKRIRDYEARADRAGTPAGAARLRQTADFWRAVASAMRTKG